MRKLSLRTEDLRVESFAPVDGGERAAGTVRGFDIPPSLSCKATCIGPTECDSCGSCPGTYADCSCDCGTGYSCEPCGPDIQQPV